MHIRKIVRKTLGIKDHRVVSVEETGCSLTVCVDVIRKRRLPCSQCGTRCKRYDRLAEREWKHVPLWGIAVTLLYRPCRIQCPQCGIREENIPWSLGKSPLSAALVVVLATWTRLLAVEVVANLFRLHWNTVYAAVNKAVKYGLECRDKESVLYIGLDEISRKKGHVYHTQVYDLTRKILLWSGEGRKEETLRRFFTEYGIENLKQVKAVCCDMWAPYANVVQEMLPDAILVFDKFHVISHLMKAVDNVRRDEAKRLKNSNPELLKGTRYLFLKNPWNLTEKQKKRLGFLEKLNLKINRAYVLKEEFRNLWNCYTPEMAASFLKDWFWKATHSRIEEIRDFAWLLRRHQDGILAWFDVPINNGAVEAMNNNAKVISRRARGFRTQETFTNILLHCMGGLELPQTTHKFL